MAAFPTASRTAFVIAVISCLLLATEVSLAQFTFDPVVNTALANRPDGVAAGDWDGDGDRDLAITSDDLDRINIYFNSGTGVFGAPVILLTGAGTGAGFVRAADLDGDTDLDLAVALQNANSVFIALNNGAGTFTSGGTFAVGLDPRGLVAGNWDGDADIDLAVVNRDGNSVSILRNNGNATFAAAVNVAVGLDPRQVAAGDWDGDTDLDLAVTNHDDRTVSILRNNGSGTFTVVATLSVGANVRPEGIDAGDLDGDNDPDLAVGVSDPSFAAIFINNAGVFSGPVNYSTGGLDTGSIILADLDCDTDLDVVTMNESSGNISLLPNFGNGTFAAPTLLPVGTTPQFAAAADLDGDQDPDLVVTNRDSNNWSKYINQTCAVGPSCGDGTCDPGENQCNCPQDCGAPPATETSCNDGMDNDCDGLTDCADVDCAGAPNCQPAGFQFDPAISVATGLQPAATAPGDYDGDGDEDLAVTTDTPDQISILLNNGAATFAAGQVILTGAGTGADHLVSRDVDGDGDLDLVVALHNINSIRFYLNNGAAVFAAGGTSAVGVDPRHIEMGHFNGDTLPDAAVVNRDGNSVSILLNAGGGNFGAATTLAIGVDPREAASGDWDGDMDIDLAVTSHDDRTIRVLTNNGAGVFAQTATLNVSPVVRPQGIDAADLDGDNDPDLAVTAGAPEVLSIFVNTGAGFSGPIDYPNSGLNGGSLIAVDLDCDGDKDVAIANQDSNNVSAMENNGAGVFGQALLLAVGTRPEHIESADFDNNGSPDLVTANRDSNNLSVILNQSCPVCAVPGDFNGDLMVSGYDIQDFVTCVMGGPCSSFVCADLNSDQELDQTDVAMMVDLLLGF